MRHFLSDDTALVLPEPCRDAALVNAFANHPQIRPFIGGKGDLDLSCVTYDPHVALFGEHGGFCLTWSAPDCYEIHTLIAPEGRGAWAEDFARRSFAYMTLVRDARHLWTRVHPEHRHTALFTRRMGLRHCGSVPTDFGDGAISYLTFEWRAGCPQQ